MKGDRAALCHPRRAGYQPRAGRPGETESGQVKTMVQEHAERAPHPVMTCEECGGLAEWNPVGDAGVLPSPSS
ncbi:hypothetical protein GCM10018781_77650 [Kitasatospora indigofera]|uniref:Uncharacterized protein n=1 Tax=Kitasatospora indigofera TaxID=67307 RepID=A0A919D8X6_9ACTN|nr:hypothetical protein GCM10018781_77650 [Kitasatospora indigofera]